MPFRLGKHDFGGIGVAVGLGVAVGVGVGVLVHVGAATAETPSIAPVPFTQVIVESPDFVHISAAVWLEFNE